MIGANLCDRSVLYINRVGFLGGVERVLVTLAAGMTSRGFRPLIVCPGDGELARAALAEGIEVMPFEFDRMRISANPFVLGRYPRSSWRSARHVIRQAIQNKVSLIHVHHPVGALYALPAARWLKIPLVLHLHDAGPVKPLYALALKLAVRQADQIICVSKAALELASLARADPDRLHVISNGVDRRFLEVVHEPTPSVRGAGPHIGVFGVIEPRKGQDVFLRAASLLSKRFPTAQFWVVGPAALTDKAPYARALETLAESLGIADRVTFTGFQPDVARWMMAMDVVALTSVAHESLGMVLVEALALGRKVVASNSGGTSEVVQNGETERLVPPGDPAALAYAVTELLDKSDTMSGAKAAEDIRKRFSPDLFCDRVASVYDIALLTAIAKR